MQITFTDLKNSQDFMPLDQINFKQIKCFFFLLRATTTVEYKNY